MNDYTTCSDRKRAKAEWWQRLLLTVDAELAEGKKKGVTFKSLAEIWAGSKYDEGSKAVSPKAQTIRKKWTAWVAAERSIDSLVDAHEGSRRKVPQALVDEFQRRFTEGTATEVRPVYRRLVTDWRSGKDIPGLPNVCEYAVPGNARPDFPFSERTFYNLKPSKAQQALGQKGFSAFKEALPSIMRTTSTLRPGELFVFDDKDLDLFVWDNVSRQAVNPTAYIAQDVATRRIVAFMIRAHSSAKKEDVNELVANTLAQEGYSDSYKTHLLFERGTLTMSQDAAELLHNVTSGQIIVHWSELFNGKARAGGPASRGKGNPRGKSTLEAWNRRCDSMIQEMRVQGAKGRTYNQKPEAIYHTTSKAPNGMTRYKGGQLGEVQELMKAEEEIGKHLQLDTNMLWLSDFQQRFGAVIEAYNASRDHEMEGFGGRNEFQIAPGVWAGVKPPEFNELAG